MNDDVVIYQSNDGLVKMEAIVDASNEIASNHMARRTFIGNIYILVKDPNLVSALTGHVEGIREFTRYRTIDIDMKKDLVKILEGKESLFSNESLTKEIDVSFLGAQPLGYFLPILKGQLDTLDDFSRFLSRNKIILRCIQQGGKVRFISISRDHYALISVKRRIQVKRRRECPSLCGKQESVVAEMVVRVSDTYVEGYTAVQLPNNLFDISASTYDKIHDV